MGYKLPQEKRDEIYQQIQDQFLEYETLVKDGTTCVLCTDLITMLLQITGDELFPGWPTGKTTDKEWALHILQFCEQKIYTEDCCKLSLFDLVQIARRYIDIDTTESIKRSEYIYNLVLKEIQSDSHSNAGELIFMMATGLKKLDIKRSYELYEKAIKLETNPSLLMIIGDALSQNFDEENTSLMFKNPEHKLKESNLIEKNLQTKSYQKALNIITSKDYQKVRSDRMIVSDFISLVASITWRECGNNHDWGIEVYKKAIEFSVVKKYKEGLNQIADSIEDWRWGNNPEWAEEVRSLVI